MVGPFDRVVIVGLGLIGGSIAKALAPLVDVVGVDVDLATRATALADGIQCSSLDDALTPTSLVIVAVPVNEIESTFSAIAAISTEPLITDVGSVKTSIIAAARATGLRFVGGHPMAGSEHSGYHAAVDSLFSGARWALTLEPDTNIHDWLAVARVAIAVGAGVVPVTAASHDEAVAAVSHLPHVLAAALANAAGTDPDSVDLRLGLAAGSFRDGTRVARSPSSFWSAVLCLNATSREAMVDALAGELHEIAAALRLGDAQAVEEFFARGAELRTAFDERTSAGVTLSAADDVALRNALLRLGAQGGFVTHVESEPVPIVVHGRAPIRSARQ